MESPHTLAFQAVNTAAQWNLEISWPRMSHPEAEALQGWIDSLQGQVGTFRYTPRSAIVRPLEGRTLTLPAYGYGNIVRMSGWAANTASQLTMGQLFTIGEQLLRITAAPANADANGQVTVEFAPMLRRDQAAGTAVNFTTPSGLFRLTTAEGPAYTLDVDRTPSFPALIAKEVI